MPHKSHRALRGHQREVLVRSCRLQAMVAARGFQLEMRRVRAVRRGEVRMLHRRVKRS